MAFFSNSHLNNLNIHYGLRAFAWEMCNLFSFAYLYKQGLGLPFIFLTYVGMYTVRIVTRPIAMKLCLTKGIRYTLICGTFVFACRYLSMIYVNGFNETVIPFVFISGFAEVLYWISYHNYFASIGAEQDRGANVGAREALATFVAILGPICGGFLLEFDRVYAFATPFLLTVLSMYPLFKGPVFPVPLKPTRQERKTVDKFGFIVFMGDGLFYQAGAIWPLIVFMMLKENYESFGFILALAGVFRVIGNLVFGPMIDKGKGTQIAVVGYSMQAMIQTVRGVFTYTVPMVIICDFFVAIAYCFSMTSLMAAVYNATKKSQNSLYFTYHTEFGWDVGAIMSMILCAILAWSGIDVRWGLSISVIGGVISMKALVKYYNKQKRKPSLDPL